MRNRDKYCRLWLPVWLCAATISAALTTACLIDSRGPQMSPLLCLGWFAAAWITVICAWRSHGLFLRRWTDVNGLIVITVMVSIFYNAFLAYPPLPGEAEYKALRLAIYKNDLGTVQKIIASDTNPDYLPSDSRMPRLLVVASAYGELDIARVLIEHGASTADVGNRLLRQAAQRGNVALIEALLQHGVSVNDSQSPRSSSALWKAVQHDRVEAARCLLAHGAAPQSAGAAPGNRHQTWTLLHLARSLNDAAMVRLLKDAGVVE